MPLYTPDSIEILLALGLIMAFCGLIFRFRKLQLGGLPKGVAVVLFLLKCSIAFGFVAVFRHTLNGGDAYSFFHHSQYINQAWHESPSYFFRLLLGANDSFLPSPMYKYAWQLGFWSTDDSYAMLRFNAVLRCFSGGYYAVHIVFMSFFMYSANLVFYTICYHLFPKNSDNLSQFSFQNKTQLYYYLAAVLIFLLPSVAFFSSGIHKDGMIYIATSGIIFAFYTLSQNNLNLLKKINAFALLIASFALFFLFRKYLLIVLLPSVGIAFWLYLFPKKQFLQYISLFFAYFLILYLGAVFLNAPILEKIAIQQSHFIAESGGSDFYVPVLEPNAKSLLGFTPRALLNGFLQPSIWRLQRIGLGGGIMAFEVTTLLLSVVFFFVWRFRFLYKIWQEPLFYFLITYIFGSAWLYGLMVSNAGTMVRYRSISMNLLAFLLLFLVAIAEKNRSKSPNKSE
jgi:hypothetical protein